MLRAGKEGGAPRVEPEEPRGCGPVRGRLCGGVRDLPATRVEGGNRPEPFVAGVPVRGVLVERRFPAVEFFPRRPCRFPLTPGARFG